MAAGAEIVTVSAGKDFQFPANDLCKRITSRTRLIAIANPNNPTGTVASGDELLRIARSAPGAAVLVDEAYFEFYGQSVLAARIEAVEPVCGANIFQGIRACRATDRCTHWRCRSNARRYGGSVRLTTSTRWHWLVCRRHFEIKTTSSSMWRKFVNRGRGSSRLSKPDGIQFWRSHANFVLARGGWRRLHLSNLCGDEEFWCAIVRAIPVARDA